MQEILSAGIDIGTSTTQLIFSKMELENTGGFGTIPKIEIVDKKIIYKSEIYFTPLLSNEEIDGEKVKQIILEEYKKAGIEPKDLTTGAIIITGESQRKKNARAVIEELSETAGNFVVAQAGPDLESVLAGKGSGAGELSKNLGKRVVNLDIGGGTTNICVFEDNEAVDMACLDIGGRLVRIKNDKIEYISQRLKALAEYEGISLECGMNIKDENVEKSLKLICEKMAEILFEAIGVLPKTKRLELMKTNRLLKDDTKADIVTFSGGVAGCMKLEDSDMYLFNDIGILLSAAIKENPVYKSCKVHDSMETMRATVIGAGNYSMNISGSTIEYTKDIFPLKNIPIVKARLEKDEDIKNLASEIKEQAERYMDGEEKTQIAIAMKGLLCPSFMQIQNIAKETAEGFKRIYSDINSEEKSIESENNQNSLIVILEADIGKALGQALKRILKGTDIICLDMIACNSGDYIDLGEPVASGKVIPVVVKTLVFENN